MEKYMDAAGAAEAEKNVGGSAAVGADAGADDNDEGTETGGSTAGAEGREFSDEDGEDGGEGTAEEDGKPKAPEKAKKPEQTHEERRENARKRREQEHRQEVEKAANEARVAAILEVTGGKNPYTGETMTDAHDVAVYERMRRIEKAGGDPVKDYAKAVAQDARTVETDRAAAADEAKWYRDDLAAFRKAHPDVNAEELLSDPDFGEYAEAQVKAKIPLSKIYEGYDKLRTKFREEADRKVEEAKDGAAQALANARAGVGGKAGSADNLEGGFFTPEEVNRMTPAEIEKNREAIRKSMSRWK